VNTPLASFNHRFIVIVMKDDSNSEGLREIYLCLLGAEVIPDVAETAQTTDLGVLANAPKDDTNTPFTISSQTTTP